ncbi:hypothetical protein [Pseudomonas sp. KNUC1026]|uniref:hypothetical protein n=1 Tax=Pseudomonas sp. KNUC1026 TaxID=2893890 RepID=UPI001F1A4FCB|nr:hypothetical protein [Pseudomonas sp. KNUC1026]UFH50618.1 hypothetical protein LN139_05395 [Pseudomonas sp. KNUC1026]
MSGINPLFQAPVRQPQAVGKSEINNDFFSDRTPKTAPNGPVAGSENQISSFSQALSDAAIRAAERDANTNRSELAKIARTTIEKLSSDSYQKNKAVDDAEVPSSDNAQRIFQARQATDYLHNKGENPFKGMPPDQLSLIIYDEGGSFTTNERRAAYDESYSQHFAWQTAVCAKVMDEYHRTRKTSSELCQEILNYYKSLPR